MFGGSPRPFGANQEVSPKDHILEGISNSQALAPEQKDMLLQVVQSQFDPQTIQAVIAQDPEMSAILQTLMQTLQGY